MKKVLIIGMTGKIGGVETFISNLLDKIDNKKFKVDLLLFNEVNDKYKNTLKKANNVYYIHPIKNNPMKYFIDIIRFYIKHKYDIIHLNECTAKLFVYCWPSIFIKREKLIVHSHSGGQKKNIFHTFLKKWQNHKASAFWSCSEEASEWMFGKKIIDKENIKLINNGIDVDKYLYSKSTRDAYRDKMKVQSDTVVIGSIARFESQKNHELIINIFDNYLKKNADSLLVLVGEGSLKKDIMNKVSNLGIQKKVLFLENRDDIPNLLQSFDVLLMPSLYEGLPFVGLEAQASGIPVITSNTVDASLKITRLVDFINLNDSLDIWSKAINGSINSNNDRENSHKYIEDSFLKFHYDLKGTIKYIETLYSEL